MNANEKYTEQIKKINALREALRKDPDNKKLEARIQTEENKLFFEELNKSEEELKRFFNENGLSTEFNEDF